MKKLLKISGYIIISILFLTVILVVAASLSQKKIVDIALNKISESINVPVEIKDLSFTFIKRFPFATVELSGVKIGAVGSFHTNSANQPNDDILNIKSAFVSVKTMPLFKGEFEIIKIEIDAAALNYKVDSLGHSNIDYLINSYGNASDTTQTNSSTLPTLNLRKVKLKNVAIHYTDDSTQLFANVFITSLDIAGIFADEKFAGTLEGDMKLTKCSYANTSLNKMEEAIFDFKMDYNSDTLQLSQFEANVDGAKSGISGKIAFTSNLYTDLTIDSKKLELGKLLKYVPDTLLEEYGINDLDGILSLMGTIKGNVSDSVIPAVDFAIELNNGYLKTKNYPNVKKLGFKGIISNGTERNNKTTSLIFKSFHAETDSSKVDLSLSVSNIDKPKYTLNSKLNINIEEFKDFIPDSLAQHIRGVIIAEISTKGVLPDSIDDNFINLVTDNSSANISFSNLYLKMDSLVASDFSGSLVYYPGHVEISNLNGLIPAYHLSLTNSSFNAELTGPITQAQNLGIQFKSFYAETKQAKVWGSAKIENLEHPDFDVKANAQINLSELKPFIPDTLLKNLSGNIVAEISTHGKLNLDSIAEQVNDIVFKQSEFTFDAKNISVTMPDTLQKFTDLNGWVQMGNDTIFIVTMSGNAAGIDFSIDSATIVNVYNTVIKNLHEKVFAYGNFEFGAIDYSTLTPFIPGSTSENINIVNSNKDTVTDKIALEENINNSEKRNFLYEFKGKIAAKSFKYEKIFLENISAKFNLSDSVYIIDKFKANAFDGSTNSSLRMSVTGNNRQIVNVKNIVDRMDIKKLLYAFDNFGYDSLISYENISGLFSAVLNSRLVFQSDTLVTEDMRVMGDLTLENGKLVNYQPAMDVASFTGIKELDNIDLKTLKSNIFLFKNQMYVPITDIVSSSMDFSTFGMQSFGDNYEYHLQMRLSEALKGKSKKLIERQNSSGDEISKEDMDRNTIKIIYAYLDGKQKTGFDTKKAQKAMTLKIKVQQTMLDLIFHPKLVSFETGVK